MSTGLSFFKIEQIPRIEHCEKHGHYESRNQVGKIWTICPKCNAEESANRAAAEKAREELERISAFEKKLGSAGIPPRFLDRTFASYEATSSGQQQAAEMALKLSQEINAGHGASAIFCGKPGTGKTHLAVAVGHNVIKYGKAVLFITVQRMVRRVKDSWRSESKESESDVVKLLVQPDLLILDEIGVQFGTDFEKNLLFDVLNERYENRKSTLLLSNLTANEVRVFLGDRVFDRLREDGGKCVPFTWDSHRGKA